LAAADADLALAVERSAVPEDEVEARRARVGLLLAGDTSGREDELKIIEGAKQQLASLSQQLGLLSRQRGRNGRYRGCRSHGLPWFIDKILQ